MGLDFSGDKKSGSKCIKKVYKKIFYSQSCKYYTVATNYQTASTYSSNQIFLPDETKDPNSYRKPYTCIECISSVGYYKYSQKVDKYFFGEGLNFKLKPTGGLQLKIRIFLRIW